MFISVFQRAQAAAPQVFPLPRAPVSAAARLCQAARPSRPAAGIYNHSFLQTARKCVSV